MRLNPETSGFDCVGFFISATRVFNSKGVLNMRTTSSFASLIFVVILGIGGGLAYATYSATDRTESICIGVSAFVIAVIVFLAIRVADQWDKAVILRLGKFHALKGPGLFLIVPVIDAIPYWIDTRSLADGQEIKFTFHWPGAGHWEGTDFVVRIGSL